VALEILETIIGHGEVVKSLTSSLAAGKVGHAYLWLGPAGVGKKTLAKAFAKQLLCEAGGKARDCRCSSCCRFESGNHPDFIIVEPEGNTLKIDQIRQVQHQAYLSPVMGKRKIYFFPEAEKLTDVASNSFLKLLEEAPPGIVFMFVAVRADSILPTIRSRCQVYHLFPVPVSEIEERLLALGYSPAEARKRSVASQGLPGLALKEVTEGDSGSHQWRIADLIRLDLISLFKVSEELEKKERKDILLILRQWETELRGDLIRLETPDSVTRTTGALERVAELLVMCEYNVNVRLMLDDFFTTLKRLYTS